jgi:hypothetical protein
MNRFCTISTALVLMMSCLAKAEGAPPTVTPSPGYDARLQEQRAASAAAAPVDPVARPAYRPHHVKRAR